MTSPQSKRIRTIFALVITVFSVAAFALVIGKDSGSSSSGNSDSTKALSSSEIDFLTMMIPHHEQAIEMSGLALTRSDDDEVLQLAEQIKNAQGPEISQMRSLLQEFGIEENPSSHGAHMHGMLTDSEMRELEAAIGSTFDRLFLTGMIKHHEGAIDMVALVGDSQRLSSLGEAIFTAQNDEIAKMQEMLARKG
ncbi:MAG: DUF305 domain-containing protein [Actinobacteria bacterium]|nr:DUF305 domain-containing protein [Actinomycetota bacterium]